MITPSILSLTGFYGQNTKMTLRRAPLWAAAAATCAIAWAQETDSRTHPLVPPAEPVTDTYFGHRVTDPYRWMEDTKNPALLNWMKQQDEYAQVWLNRLPFHGEFVRREREVRVDGVSIERVRRQGQRYAYSKEGAPSN